MEQERILLTLARANCHIKNITIYENTPTKGMHFHPELEVIYVDAGEADCIVDGEKLILKQGTVTVIGSGVPHRIMYGSAPSTFTYLQFDPAAILQKIHPEITFLPYRCREDLSKYISAKPGSSVYENCISAIKEIENKEKFFETAATGIFISLIAQAQRLKLLPDYAELLNEASFRKIIPAINYAEGHCSEKIFLDRMCDELCIDKFNFCKTFKKAIGITFFQYLTELRLHNAEKLLSGTSKSITEIAFECGFSTVQYFNSVFVKTKGCTPSSFRKSLYRG